MTGVGDWHINADEPSILDYNTEFKTPAQVEPLRARPVPHLGPRPGRRRAQPDERRPVVGSVTGPSTAVSVGTPVTVSAPFTDADPLDTHTATIAWGDGSTSPAP